MIFKKRLGIKLSYNKQGLVHFICANYRDMPDDIQDRIINLCISIAGKDYKALFDALTNEHLNMVAIAEKYFISEKKLYSWRKEFYEYWYQ